MKKTILFTFFLSVLTIHLSAQQNYDNNAFKSDLSGNPKIVETTIQFFTEAVKNDSPNHESYITTNYYKPNGIRYEQRMTALDGELIGSTVFNFSDDGNVSYTDYTDQYGNLVTRVKYTYNGFDKWQNVKVFRGAFQLMQQLDYQYDATGKIDEITQYGYFGTVTESETFTYDQQGRDSVKTFYDNRHKPKLLIFYRYDDSGNLIASRNYTPSLQLMESYEAKYNDKNIIVSSVIRKLTSNGVITTTFSYDSLGNPVKKTESSSQPGSNSSITTISYEYDNLNNWTKKTIKTDNLVTISATRIISYY